MDEVETDLTKLVERVEQARSNKEAVSIAYQGNIVDLWEHFVESETHIDLGSDQTSLHLPFDGGYYPVDMSLEAANELMSSNPEDFKTKVKETLVRHVNAVNKMVTKGMFFGTTVTHFFLRPHVRVRKFTMKPKRVPVSFVC